MSDLKIYHNPNCSKSRQTLKLIRDRNAKVEVTEYLIDPPSASELDEILDQLGKEPIELIRTKEDLFNELGLSIDDDRSRSEWIEILVKNPILIERPIVVKGERAILGRPPENVLQLI